MHDVNLMRVALDSQFNLDSRALYEAAAAVDLVILASPNNPTGRRIPRETLLSILAEREDRPVLLDETYAEFCGQNGIPWLERFPNLLILRTVSKARGLPGLRCGFLIGRPEMIGKLEALRSPYNVCAVSSYLAARLPAEDPGYERRLRRAVSARHWLQSELRRRELVTYPSDAHFCLLRLGIEEAENLADFMKARSILIKNMNKTLPGFLRISVNSRKQAVLFLQALDEWARANFSEAEGDISDD
jgi:histidinol-phosphate aminotransferase